MAQIEADSSVELFRLVTLRAPATPTQPGRRIQVHKKAARPPVAKQSAAPNSTTTVDPADGQLVVDGVDFNALDRFLAASDDLVAPPDIANWLKAHGVKDLPTLVSSPEFAAGRDAVHTALISSVQSNVEMSAQMLAQLRVTLMRYTRLFGLLERLAGPDAPAGAQDVFSLLRYSVVTLPADALPQQNLLRPPVLGDLKVVRTGTPRYEAGAIAHIENVMASEHRVRNHRLLDQLETTTTTDTQVTTETEEDLATTSQVNLQQQVSRALSESTDLQAGLSISASYGPTVKATLTTDVAYHSSRDESAQTAADYSNQITRQARKRVVEQVRETRTTRHLVETEENNLHEFDNRTNAGNLTGVYRWVDSVQDCWVENYGLRMMLDFVLPEPAAFLRWAIDHTAPRFAVPTEPDAPTVGGQRLSPELITTANYQALVGAWGASNVPTPPAESVDLSLSYQGEKYDDDLYAFHDSSTLKVPIGYRATGWTANGLMWGKSNDADASTWIVAVGGGAEGSDIQQDGTNTDLKRQHSGTLNAEENSIIPVLMLGRGILQLMADVRVHCELTAAGKAAWQQKVYDAVMAAYQKQHDDWAAQKARIESQQMAEAAYGATTSPDENREIEKRELRRGLIQMLLGYPPSDGMFAGDAVVPGTDTTPPTLDLGVAAQERGGITFLEEAFDWNLMNWVLYPYYWAKSSQWANDVRRSAGDDPIHAAFLSAGAARVVLPVRVGFESAISFYLATGIMWSGGPVPTIDDPTYVAIADEIAESLGTGGSVPLDRVDLDPVRLPTSLIWLQPSADLNPTP